MKVNYHSYQLPFRFPFTISRGTKTHQPTLLVELEHFGVKGYGEAPAITYYHITVEDMIRDIESRKMFIEKFAFTDPERYWHYLHHLIPGNPFLVCALDMAAWDLFGKLKNKPLYQLWGLDMSKKPVTDYTIGMDTIEKMVSKMKEKPWPVYKVKVGTANDIQMVRALRENTESVIRVDANAGWTLEEALQKIPQLKELGVELVEQPLPKENWEDMKILFERSPLPLIADESCVSEQDVDKCKGYFHGINIKLTKCSGITPARRMISRARELDLKIMIGCMNETTVGSSAMAHLSPLVDYLDMDGPLLLNEDIATGLEYADGNFSMAGGTGLCIRLMTPAQ
ncbi:MAG: dipeptide epimerase [Terrimonas sp.]|nr:dipeptide epimerase [Terrimonas sp.]